MSEARRVVVVGAGPGDPDLLTAWAIELLGAEPRVVVADVSLVGLARSLAPGAAVLGADAPAPAADGLVVRLVLGDGLAAPLEPGDLLVPGVAADALTSAAARLSGAPSPRPLHGYSIVVTRPRHQAGPLSRRLRRLGATVVEFPTISLDPPADEGHALDGALGCLADYEWLLVTSANGAAAILERLSDARAAAGIRIAAIGPATAAVLTAARLPPDLVPPQFVAESLLEVFPRPRLGSGTGRVLLARAAVARDVLPVGLRTQGWSVDVVEAYRTTAAQPDLECLADVVAADVITFTSPSTFEQFKAIAGLPSGVQRVACIGPVTAEVVRSAGVEVFLEASVHTVEGLVEELVAKLSSP